MKRRNKTTGNSSTQLTLPLFDCNPHKTSNEATGKSSDNSTQSTEGNLCTKDCPIDVSRSEALLCEAAGRSLEIIYTNNRSRIISCRKGKDGFFSVRISRIMKTAPAEVWRELGLWIKNSRKNKILCEGTHSGLFIRQAQIQEQLAETKPRQIRPLKGLGRCFNLTEIFDRLNALHFDGLCDAKVGWSRKPVFRARHSIRLGSYHDEGNYILINPVLDWERVPLQIVEGTLIHEMTHWKLRHTLSSGKRRQLHTGEFRELMRRWSGYEECEYWVKSNTSMLIRRRNFLSKNRRR